MKDVFGASITCFGGMIVIANITKVGGGSNRKKDKARGGGKMISLGLVAFLFLVVSFKLIGFSSLILSKLY